MRVVIATGLFFPDIGGPATYSKMLVDALPKRGIEVDVVSFGTVRTLPRLVRHVVYFRRVYEAAREADLIYAQDPFSVGFPSLIAAVLLRKPLLLKIVGDYAWEQGTQRFGVTKTLDLFVERYALNPMVCVLQLVQTLVAKSAKQVIVPSEYLKRVVGMWGVNPRKISVIYNAFEGVQEPESKEALRDKLGLAGSVVLSAGRLVPWKGFSELIALVPTLREQIPNLRLLIIGEGPERSRLLAQIDQLGLKDVVVLMHRQPQTVLLNHVRAADLFVLNSSYEGFSHLLLEVMAIGTPLVATRVGGNPELIEDRESGLLVPVRDGEALTTAIVSVLNDVALSSKLVANGRSRVQSFSEERMISELEAVMKTLCAS